MSVSLFHIKMRLEKKKIGKNIEKIELIISSNYTIILTLYHVIRFITTI